jgi:DNA-binding response OmpR family regulator
MSTRGDLTTRLQVVRASGNAYFTKPIDISGMIDKLNTLTGHEEADPYHLLIVDDDSVCAIRNTQHGSFDSLGRVDEL